MKIKANLNQVFLALASEYRRQIIFSLSLYPRSISQLASQLVISLPAIHKHIDVLQKAGLIVRKKSGRTNFLTLNKSKMQDLRDWILQFQAYWGNDVESLENYVAMIKAGEKNNNLSFKE